MEVRRALARIALASLALGALTLAAPLAASATAPASRPVASLATTPSTPATPTRPPARPATITVTAVGDLLFDSAPKRLIRARGGRAPFSATRKALYKADVTVGNLECPLSSRGSAVSGKTFTFRGDPRAIQGLTWAGFDLLAMGNNHARDYGGTALADTFKTLDKARIAHAGAGKNRSAAWRPAIIKRKGAKIAFLSFSQIGPSTFAATSSRSGTAYTMSSSAINRAIKSAHKKADYVIVSFHWGIERSYYANSRQINTGRAAIRSGADLVLSHHPHVIQGVEFYRKGLIAYSLGNFVFSPGSMAGRDSMILHLTLSPKGVSKVSAQPVWIGYDGKPVLKTGATARRILGIVKRTSVKRGSHVSVKSNVARITP